MKKLPQRVGAAIIKDNRMLVVSQKGKDEYWTPGGKVEVGENVESALRREIKEELGIEVISMELIDSGIKDDTLTGVKKEFFYFFVKTSGEISLSAEINKIMWVSKIDLSKGNVEISRGAKDCLNILIKRGLLS